MHRCLGAALALAWACGAAASAGLAPFKDPRTCKGYEKEYKDCEGLPACFECKPVNCEWHEWDDWFEAGGCTGVCFRHRGIKTTNNECGTPCNGTKQETKDCSDLRPECRNEAQDCVMSEWSTWTTCSAEDFTGQKVRERRVITPPKYGGDECDGSTKETMPCGENPAVDCELSEWGEWTECSVSCGTGWHAQMRRVKTEAKMGGRPCEDVTRRTQPCNKTDIAGKVITCGEKQDCQLGEWSEWSGCGLLAGVQKYRTRTVKQPALFGGAPCETSVKETAACPSAQADARPCTMSQWTAWVECSRSCDGGQTYRRRHIEHGPENGGECVADSLHETKACGTDPCVPPGENDCGLSAWSDWSECSNKCGTGVSERERKVLSDAKLGGKGCNGGLKETQGCEGADKETCGDLDCQWAEWEQWSACTCSCGGGTKRRERMIAVAPKGRGTLCDAKHKSEVEGCNTQNCTICRDGVWAEWEAWSACSATCDKGFRSRHRDVAQHPNDCGAPVVGLEDEYELCHAAEPCVPDSDCQLSEWTAWSSCSCKCFGVSERTRHVIHYATGRGKTCHAEALKEVSQCNPGIGESSPVDCGKQPPEPCTLGAWSEWGVCSATCSGGQKIRTRHVLSPAKNEGEPCAGDLSETVPCATEPCERNCQDCEWSHWSPWSNCTKCGNQRTRHRSVVKMPNECGKPCDMDAAKEVTSCESECEEIRFCAWSEWSSFSPCSATCGPSTRLRQRAMLTFAQAPASYLFKGDASAACSGAQMDISACEPRPCEAQQDTVDCVFGEWAKWSDCDCTGLQERHRVIERMPQNHGELCEGQLIETQKCEPTACTKPKDCILSKWGEWGHCDTHQSQRYRSRSVLQQASHGGAECPVGNLEETASCSEGMADIQSCSFSRWSEWTTCDKSCGTGLQSRERAVQNPAENGGAMCEGNLQELRMCNTDSCDASSVKCEWHEWGEWSGDCLAPGTVSKERERTVKQEPTNGGAPCEGAMKEYVACESQGTPCVTSGWTEWDGCDKKCGGGQAYRHRQVIQNPQGGGAPCNQSLVEIKGCNMEPCNRQDCAVSDWQEWGACTSTCGSGQQVRSRNVLRLPADGGEGCTLGLNETRACELAKCEFVDCIWGLWSDWGDCSCKCGGGMRTRDRHIVQAPQQGGKACPAWDKEETDACNTHPCKQPACIDGQWDEWEEWEPCSKSCKGGMTWRTRKVLHEANECGTPAEGLSREYQNCNEGVECEEPVDCKLSEWGMWSACSKTCDGIMRRSRRIEVTANAKGKQCEGDLKQTAPCNPYESEDRPPACMGAVAMDCQISEWQAWEPCSAPCGGGQQKRSRDVAKEAEGGGHCPHQSLEEMRACNGQACPNDCMPEDCVWNEWSEWSACDKCGGQKRRFRHVARVARCGGAACEHGMSEEVTNCTRACHEVTYCAFGNWGSWSMCSATCGTGVHSRERHLQVTTEAEMRLLSEKEPGFQAKYEQLRSETEELQRRHVQTLAMSFAAGLLSLMVGLAAVRAAARRTARSSGLANQRDVEVTLE